ncbi:NACHT, LRR and PYD domains-containing protein 12-like, partial [Clarias magur]
MKPITTIGDKNISTDPRIMKRKRSESPGPSSRSVMSNCSWEPAHFRGRPTDPRPQVKTTNQLDSIFM